MNNLGRLLRGIAALAVSGLLLGACASSDGLSSQGRMATPAALGSANALANVDGRYARTWPAADWWRALGDPQLDALIDEALQGNPDLAVAEARVRQASAMALDRDAQRSPTLTGQAAVLNIRIPGSASLSSSKTVEELKPRFFGLNGNYNLDLWGGQRAAWEAALGQQHAAEIEARATRLDVSVDVALAYLQLDYVYQTQARAQKDVDRSRRYLELITQRVDAGIESLAQQRQAESYAADARRALEQTGNDITTQKIALALLIGKGPDRADAISRPLKLNAPALAMPDNLPADLLGRRPDIVAARWRVEAAQRDIDASRAGFYPSFNLTAAFGLASFRNDDLISLRSRYYALAPAITLPIFDGGRLRAELAGRNADYDIAVAQYNKNLVGALNDVARQIQSSRSLTAQESEQRQSVNAARESWKLAVQRYEHGIGSYIDALIAEKIVIDAQAELLSLHARQMSAAVLLVNALGGGYSDDSFSNPAPRVRSNDKISS